MVPAALQIKDVVNQDSPLYAAAGDSDGFFGQTLHFVNRFLQTGGYFRRAQRFYQIAGGIYLVSFVDILRGTGQEHDFDQLVPLADQARAGHAVHIAHDDVHKYDVEPQFFALDGRDEFFRAVVGENCPVDSLTS